MPHNGQIDRQTDRNKVVGDPVNIYIYSDSTLQGENREHLGCNQSFGKVGVISAQS